MFENIKLFQCRKLYLLKINKPSRWKRAKMAAVSDGRLLRKRSGAAAAEATLVEDEKSEKKCRVVAG